MDDTIPTIPNVSYELEIAVQRSDTGDQSEYAEIEIDGKNYGMCNPDGADGDCTWYTCSNLLSNDIFATKGEIRVRIQFSADVSVANSYCGSKRVSARISLKEKGYKFLFNKNLENLKNLQGHSVEKIWY